MNAEEL